MGATLQQTAQRVPDDDESDDESETRMIAAQALRIFVTDSPAHSAATGPGMNLGPSVTWSYEASVNAPAAGAVVPCDG